MSFLNRLFGLKPSAAEQREMEAEYRAMCEAVAREKQKRQFYLEVAALLGNESAAKALRGDEPLN
jgi:rubrerythrin